MLVQCSAKLANQSLKKKTIANISILIIIFGFFIHIFKFTTEHENLYLKAISLLNVNNEDVTICVIIGLCALGFTPEHEVELDHWY